MSDTVNLGDRIANALIEEIDSKSSPKPMPPKPKAPVEKAIQRQIGKVVLESGVSKEKAADLLSEYGTITQKELHEFAAVLNGITPAEMHGEEPKVEKPKYVLKPHLTERPLKQHEGLMALRKQMEDSKPKRSGQSRTHKEKK